MSKLFLYHRIHNDIIYFYNNINKIRRYSTSVSSFVRYFEIQKGFNVCTICKPYNYNINYFNKTNGSLFYGSNSYRIRFFSTVPNYVEESLDSNVSKEELKNGLLNAVKAYNSEKNDDVSDLVEELVEDTGVSRERVTVEELFEIPDYHEYLISRIIDVNGTRRSPLQKLLPVDYIQQMFITVHDFTNLNWSSTICLITIFFKILVLPIWCRSEKSRRMNAYLIPKATELQEKAKQAFSSRNEKLAREAQMEIYKLTKKNSFIKGVLIQTGAAAVQGLMFGTVYGGLRLFAIDPKFRPDFTFEPCLWLDSLCLPDPYFILPSIFGILMTLVFEHNLSLNYSAVASAKGSGVVKLQNKQKYMKFFSRFGIILFTLYGFTMPSSAFFYLIPSFLFQTVLRYSCNKFLVSRFLGIPLPIIKKNKNS